MTSRLPAGHHTLYFAQKLYQNSIKSCYDLLSALQVTMLTWEQNYNDKLHIEEGAFSSASG
jgi:hypothetical protein